MPEIISEAQMLHLMTQHSIWIVTSQGATHPTGSKLSLIDASFSDMAISAQNLSSAEFVRCQVANVTFIKCDFSGSILIGSIFNNCSFLECSFVKADFRSANCSGVDFTGSDLTRADLTDSTFKDVNLTNCRLNWAWLIETDLRNAILDHTEFKGARMVGTKVYNSRRFTLGTLEQTVVKDIDISPQGDGEKRSGIEAIDFLREN